MKVYFITSSSDIDSDLMALEMNSLVIIGHGVGVNIDLVRELEGDDDCLKRLSIISRNRHIVIVAGIEAAIYRRKYFSAVVINNGKVMGISDATHEENDNHLFNLGASYRVYKTEDARLGIAVGNDLLYPEVFRTLRTHTSNVILALAGRIPPVNVKNVLKSMAFLNGISILGIVNNRAYIVGHDGEILLEDDGTISVGEYDTECDDSLTCHIRNNIYDNVYIEE